MKEPLIMHLKEKYYDMICEGKKTTEYRECKPYWIKRLEGRKEVVFKPGYSAPWRRIVLIENIRFVSFCRLPKYVKDEFKSSSHKYFIAIDFKLKEK